MQDEHFHIGYHCGDSPKMNYERRRPFIRAGFVTAGSGMFQVKRLPEKILDAAFPFIEMGSTQRESRAWDSQPFHIDRDALYPTDYLFSELPAKLSHGLICHGLMDVYGFYSGKQILDIFQQIFEKKRSKNFLNRDENSLLLPKMDDIQDAFDGQEPPEGIGGTAMLSVKELAKILGCHENHLY